MPNPYTSMLPPPPVEDTRVVVQSLRQFAAALEEYPGQNMDVEVRVTVYPEDGPDEVAEVQMSVYVPKTEYVNLVLIARCQGSDGFPVTIDPYFAANEFPNGLPLCQNQQELDNQLQRFAQSAGIRLLLDYMKRHAQKRVPKVDERA